MDHTHNLFDMGSYVLPEDLYETLCDVRDKLSLLSQLTGKPAPQDDHSGRLVIDRILIARLFDDLHFQVTVVLEGTSPTSNLVVRVRTC